MSTNLIFPFQLLLGYVAWGLCFGAFILPRLKAMEPADVQRVIATLHSFRFFGLAFIVPGVVSSTLPQSFSHPAAFGDLATALLAMLTLAAFRFKPLFRSGVVVFNSVGIIDLLLAYYHAMQAGVPAQAGQLGLMYVVPVIYVPLLMITHVAAFYFLLRPQGRLVHA